MILILIVPLLIRLVWDWCTIKVEKREVDHGLHTLVTGGIMIACAMINSFTFPEGFSWLGTFKGTSLAFGIFMGFDYALNIVVRGWDEWDYIDQGLDGKSSKTDKFYRKYLTKKKILVLKIIVFVLSLLIYFI